MIEDMPLNQTKLKRNWMESEHKFRKRIKKTIKWYAMNLNWSKKCGKFQDKRIGLYFN